MSSESQDRKAHPSDRATDAPAGSPRARRGFLLGAGAAVSAAGVAVATLRQPAVATPGETAGASSPEAAKGQGYHLTAHIRKYYDTTKV